MPNTHAKKDNNDPDKLKQIPQWAARYANNRVLLVMVTLLITSLVAFIIAVLSAGAGQLIRHGNLTLGYTLLAVDIIVCLTWLWLVLSGKLNRWFANLNTWLYRSEGQVTQTPPKVNRKVATIVAWTFGLLVCTLPIVAQGVNLPSRYLQPLTATYCVPFLVYLWWVQGRQGSIFMLIWPAGYTLHSILVLAGVPMVVNLDPMLQILLPMTLWGVVAVLASHIYSRIALRKLRELTKGCKEGEDDDA